MQYLLLFNKHEAKYRALSEAEREQLRRRYEQFALDTIDAGVAVSGAALEASDMATTVRVRGGKRMLTDGPFAETEETIAGVCLIDVPDLDEALRWAAKHPDAELASVEVRPVVPWKPPKRG